MNRLASFRPQRTLVRILALAIIPALLLFPAYFGPITAYDVAADAKYFEAEFGEITAPFRSEIGNVFQTRTTLEPSQGGRVTYTVNVAQPGDYIINAVLSAPDSNSNSFFVNINAEPDASMIWDIEPTSVMGERTVRWRGAGSADNPEIAPKVFSLDAGKHTLVIRGREKNVRLDRIAFLPLALNNPAPPTGTPAQPTPTGAPAPSPTKPAPSPTGAPAPSPTGAPAPSPTPTHDHDDAVGRCGESMMRWHPPVVNGCETGHEHGDAPPQWIYDAGYDPMFHGHFNTSPAENAAKHAAMKGFATTLKGVDVYFRLHAASNVLDRSARFHSYEIWARDPQGGVSHWQGWYNTGDPVTDRIPRRRGVEPSQRPIMLVVDQTAWDQGIRCEQWYFFSAGWSWDIGWTICNSTTLFYPGENNQQDPSNWRLAPDGGTGTTRRLEAAWYASRPHPTGTFYATQFGEIVSGPNDPRCSATSVQYGVTYQNVCLEQYIAPTMPQVSFPDNAVQKQFDDTGVDVPN
jgi:hypothetical protein